MNKFQLPKELKEAFYTDELVIFVGAGLSLPLGIPLWNDLVDEAIEDFIEDEEYHNVSILKEALDQNVMSEILIFDALSQLNPDRLEDVIQRETNKSLDKNLLSETYGVLWSITSRFITTNFDLALHKSMPSDDVVVTVHNYENLEKDLKKDNWIFHLHGVNTDMKNCIYLSEHYHDLYSKTETRARFMLRHLFKSNTVLFVGFSMKDKHLHSLFLELDRIFDTEVNNNAFIITEENTELPLKSIRALKLNSYGDIPNYLKFLSEEKKLILKKGIKSKPKFLRRRCRIFLSGSSLYEELMTEIWGKKFNENRSNEIEEQAIRLDCDYELMFINASLQEKKGNWSRMIETLNRITFEGDKEQSRLVYLAIGHEKSDEVQIAINILSKIIYLPDTNPDIQYVAKFNRLVCLSKEPPFDSVDFGTYIGSDKVLPFLNERVRDKAISNHLMLCKMKNEEFVDADQCYQESFKYETDHTKLGRIKTLVNYIGFKKEPLAMESFWELYTSVNGSSSSEKIAFLANVSPLLSRLDRSDISDHVKHEVLSLTNGDNENSMEKHTHNLKKLFQWR